MTIKRNATTKKKKHGLSYEKRMTFNMLYHR